MKWLECLVIVMALCFAFVCGVMAGFHYNKKVTVQVFLDELDDTQCDETRNCE